MLRGLIKRNATKFLDITSNHLICLELESQELESQELEFIILRSWPL